MTIDLHHIMFIVQLVLIMFSVAFIFMHFAERNKLRALMLKIIENKKINAIEDIITIKNYLQTKIKYDVHNKPKRRPLLRATALQTLKDGVGFCGENARAAILLLQYGGIKANRIYLYGKKWQHVVVEMKWKGQWCLFDGHNDPNMFLKDEMVGKIASEEINEYPNTYKMNQWVDFCRIKFLCKKPFPKKWGKIRLASIFVVIFESPNLIKAIFFILLLLISTLYYLIF